VRIEVLYAFEVITVREVLTVVNILNRVKTVHKIGKKVKISTRRVRFFFYVSIELHAPTFPTLQHSPSRAGSPGRICGYWSGL
jgi:hypothetical protein